MTVLSLIKGILVMTSLPGVVFIGVGVFKTWSAYNFAKTAEVVPGTFSGYETVLVDSTTRTSSTPGSRRGSKVTYPMFSYTDKNGHRRLESDPESHFIKRFKHGEKVTVLVSPDGSAAPRLGDTLSLFGPGISFCLIGIAFILLMSLGIKSANIYFGPLDPTVHEGQLSLRGALSEFGQSRFPVGDLVFILGGFLLTAGALVGTGTYFILKRTDQALLNALQNNDFKAAQILAYEGRGIQGKNQDGDLALIVALKANQPKVARAILGNFLVSATALSPDGSSPAYLAAVNGDHQTLAILLQKGAEAFNINSSVVYHLIVKNDIATLKVIFANGYNLDWKHDAFTLGDHAVILGNAEVVRLIQAYNGVFEASPAFIALALNDSEALNKALENPGATKVVFQNLTLKQFAKKIDHLELLERM